jgi:Domain of unknown function (DUF222)
MFDQIAAAAYLARTPGDRVRAYARAENAACAARLVAMADMLAAAYGADGSAERDQWRLDNWAAVCAQIGAAHQVTSGVASGLLMDAVTLRERLPKVAALFAQGLMGVSDGLCRSCTSRRGARLCPWLLRTSVRPMVTAAMSLSGRDRAAKRSRR